MLALLLLTSCSGKPNIALHFRLDGIDPTQVVRVETIVSVDPSDPRQFSADQPYRSVGTGIGYEVRALDQNSPRKLILTFDATIGYKFTPRFDFTLLPPDGESAPPLVVVASAYGNTNDTIGLTAPQMVKFPGALDVDLKDARCSGQACSGTTQACCSGVCEDTATDVANCGGCGVACGMSGDACTGEHCRCAGAGGCESGAKCCAGLGCLDFQSDNFNCGACGHACNPGEVCSGGQCSCNGAAACPPQPGAVCCQGAGGGCMTGTCMCADGPCAAPSTCCAGAKCVDTSSDAMNCGTCGRVCASPFVCSGGECTCAGTVCGPHDTCCATGCRDLMNDPSSCGACGKACAAGELCVGGQCQCGTAACTSDQSCCNGQCTPTAGDARNCGACGNSCRPGESCVTSQCKCVLGDGTSATCLGNQTCCNDGCFDLSNDAGHCGSCTSACGSGYGCVMGKCVQTSCLPPCTQGNTCAGTSCQCQGRPGCVAPQLCCTSGCADLTTSLANCGSCDHPCAMGDTCVKGMCLHPNGAMCQLGTDCQSNFCVDGVCCENACAGACHACNNTGNLGKCTPVSSDSRDPLCPITAANTCGTNGLCDANGNCRDYPATQLCVSPSCDASSNMFTPAAFCDGMGACKAQQPQTCAPYVCNGTTTCYKSCATAAQCIAPACNPSNAGQLIDVKCLTSSTTGVCTVSQVNCSPYSCAPANATTNAAHCNSGACSPLLGGGVCGTLNICAPSCSCHGDCITGSQCQCP
jgi:hypothetical protein